MFQAAIAIQAKLPQVHFDSSVSEIYRQPIEQAIQDYGLATVVSGQTQ